MQRKPYERVTLPNNCGDVTLCSIMQLFTTILKQKLEMQTTNRDELMFIGCLLFITAIFNVTFNNIVNVCVVSDYVPRIVVWAKCDILCLGCTYGWVLPSLALSCITWELKFRISQKELIFAENALEFDN